MRAQQYDRGVWMACADRATSYSVNAEVFNVKAFGAVGDGAVDDTRALQECLTAVPDGATIQFPPGTYFLRTSSTITVTNKSLTLRFEDGARIDARSITVSQGNPIFDFVGSVGAFSLLGASPAVGARTITVGAALAASLSEGDLIRLTTAPTNGGSGETWRGLGSTNYKGELVEVLSVSGTTVTLKDALADSYTAANTVAARISPISLRLENFTLLCDVTRAQIGLRARYLRSVQMYGGNITGASHTCLELDYAAHALIIGYRASNFWKVGVGNNYGLAICSCQDVSVMGCQIAGGRHAITTGGVEPNRRVTIGPGNTLDVDTAGAEYCLYPHDNTEGFRVFGNCIRGGIKAENAIKVVLEQNTIEAPSTTIGGINVAKSFNDDAVVIRNNHITVASGLASNVPLIQVSGQAACTLDSVRITGNELRGNSAGITVSQATTATLTIKDLEVSGNTAVISGTRRPLNIVGFANANRMAIGVARIVGNRIEGGDTTLFHHTFSNTDDFIVTGNNFRHTGAGGAAPILAANNLTILRALFLGNLARNDTQETAVTITAQDYINCQDNVLLGFSDADGVVLSASTVVNTNNFRTA